MRILNLFAVVFLVAAGCQGPSAAFTRSMDSTYRAIEPEYTAYVAADPALTPQEKALRARTIQMWRDAIDAAKDPKAVNP